MGAKVIAKADAGAALDGTGNTAELSISAIALAQVVPACFFGKMAGGALLPFLIKG